MLYLVAVRDNCLGSIPVGATANESASDNTPLSVDVVVPVYNERDTLEPLVDALFEHAPRGACRVILVDDGSTDGSARRCDEITASRTNVDAIHLLRNSGKTEALAAGFARVRADIVVTIDADLQDDPSELPRFLDAVAGGLDLVCGWKKRRRDPWTKRLPSRVYNAVTARAFGLRLHDINCGYKAMRVDVARAAVLKHDYHRLIPAIAAAQGFRVGEIEVRHHPRRHGHSKFGMERYWRGLRDAARLWWEIRTGKIPRVNR